MSVRLDKDLLSLLSEGRRRTPLNKHLYTLTVATAPMSVRLDKDLLSLLSEGRRRTPLNKQELVRRTLRLHLRDVIDSESNVPPPRLTTLAPWPPGALKKA